MDYIRPASNRGKANFGWLDSRHSFSFGSYYEPSHMGFSVLRVINEDTVIGGAGFDVHGHRDMEIISYVLEGAIQHKDSMGNRFVLPAGEIQRMSAGSGIMHSEFNVSNTKPLKFLQIWIQPKQHGMSPSYQQARIEQTASMTPLVTPIGENGSLSINQDVYLYRLQLNAKESVTLDRGNRYGYLNVINGTADTHSLTIIHGDGIGLVETNTISLTAGEQGLEALWFDLPKKD